MVPRICIVSLVAVCLLLTAIWAPSAFAVDDLPSGNAVTEGVDRAALDKLTRRARETHSNALIVVKNGKVIRKWYCGHKLRPIVTRSITKSVTSLAIGCLIDDGKIKSLDQPISDFFPELNQGMKKNITLKHILANTSGIDASEVYNDPDLIKVALSADVKSEPGTEFVYNNKAVSLLAGIVKIASGKPADEYISERILSPLGITDASWERDKAKNPLVMGGLSLDAMDLAKIGQLVLNGGIWHGKRIVSKEWISKSTNPGVSVTPWYGLLWWILPGKSSNGATGTRQPIGFRAEGYMGQNLIVLPKQQLVVVRQIGKVHYASQNDYFEDIVECTKNLVPECK
jgi:CubicO group peptidase (beta-lactamase class C family)